MFGVFRRVERRQTNCTKESSGYVYNNYLVMVTRLVFFWVTVWTWESDWT